MLRKLSALSDLFARPFEWMAPGFLLALRFYVATVFFRSGLTKITDFSSTIALFESEYKVPVISPTFAAYSGTAAELVLPVLFALGLFSRPVALAFFVFNAVAVVSYPDISDAGIKDHMLWGTMMLVVLFHGAGRLSVDQVLQSAWGRKVQAT
ncbi:MAG: DoxX family protein [Betaproteobacteria bacterium]|nr:DoxX family protein [Betaproteobacteria bacterium]